MEKRTFVALAEKFNPKRHDLRSRFVSQKLDGMRFFWDGGISRGLLAEEVPYANTAKDHLRISKVVATGLWSRYGKVITPPKWWLDRLPVGQPLDGELFTERNQLQIIVGTAKAFTPDDDKWTRMKAIVFDAPHIQRFCTIGRINETHHKATFTEDILKWCLMREAKLGGERIVGLTDDYLSVYEKLMTQLIRSDTVVLLQQRSATEWEDLYESEIAAGGEGVVFRQKYSPWFPTRSDRFLKHKPDNDSEGIVIGWTSGKETDKGSKLLGMMGSLRIKWQDKILDVSGFTDHERTLYPGAAEWATDNPGEYTESTGPMYFDIGEQIQFKYGEMTSDGIPRRAVFRRKRGQGED